MIIGLESDQIKNITYQSINSLRICNLPIFDLFVHGGGTAETATDIDFQQPRLHVAVYQDVEPVQLETTFLVARSRLMRLH
jgi:hypothetical protein